MKHDMNHLIERSRKRRAELAKRVQTRAEVRWGASIALGGVPENNLTPPRWWQLTSRLRRFVDIKAGDNGVAPH